MQRPGEVDDETVAALFGGVEVALYVDRQPIAEETAELVDGVAGGGCIAARGGEGERPLVAAGEAVQALGMRYEIVAGDCGGALSARWLPKDTAPRRWRARWGSRGKATTTSRRP